MAFYINTPILIIAIICGFSVGTLFAGIMIYMTFGKVCLSMIAAVGAMKKTFEYIELRDWTLRCNGVQPTVKDEHGGI